MKYIRCLISIAVFISAISVIAEAKTEAYSRGLLFAVDTRDHHTCRLVQEQIHLLAPFFATDICAQDGTNPISIVVMTIPIIEADFLAEVDLSKNSPSSDRDQTPGFAPMGIAGIFFILPYARESESNILLSFKRSSLSVAHVRVTALSRLEDQGVSHLALSFVLQKIPTQYTDSQRNQAERMIKRVQIIKNIDESLKNQDKETALSSLNILEAINTSIQSAAKAPNFKINLFLPKRKCSEAIPCRPAQNQPTIPLSMGFSFTMRF